MFDMRGEWLPGLPMAPDEPPRLDQAVPLSRDLDGLDLQIAQNRARMKRVAPGTEPWQFLSMRHAELTKKRIVLLDGAADLASEDGIHNGMVLDALVDE